MMPDAILSRNVGSLNLKFALFEAAGLNSMVVGTIETIDAATRFCPRDTQCNIQADARDQEHAEQHGMVVVRAPRPVLD
jgi:acetate kinase